MMNQYPNGSAAMPEPVRIPFNLDSSPALTGQTVETGETGSTGATGATGALETLHVGEQVSLGTASGVAPAENRVDDRAFRGEEEGSASGNNRTCADSDGGGGTRADSEGGGGGSRETEGVTNLDALVSSIAFPTFDEERDSPYFDAAIRKACAQSRANSVLTAAQQIAELRFQTTRNAAAEEIRQAMRKREDVLKAAGVRLEEDKENAKRSYETALKMAEDACQAELMTHKILADSARFQTATLAKLETQLQRAKEAGSSIPDVEKLKGMEARERSKLLSCPITHEVFVDPVLAPSGITYERSAITRWVRSHYTDPMARTPLTTHQLTSNLAIKDFIQRFPHLTTLPSTPPPSPPVDVMVASSLVPVPSLNTSAVSPLADPDPTTPPAPTDQDLMWRILYRSSTIDGTTRNLPTSLEVNLSEYLPVSNGLDFSETAPDAVNSRVEVGEEEEW